MSSTRQRRGASDDQRERDKSEESGGSETRESHAPTHQAESRDSESYSVVPLLTHLSLLLFYIGVHVWGAAVLKGVADRKDLKYEYNPLKMLTFATIQNLYIQTMYSALAVLCDLLPASKLKTKLENVRCYIFTTLAFPVAMIVMIMYWGLLVMDSKHLYDARGAALMAHVPLLLNHCWHTVVGIAVLLEVFLVVTPHPTHSTSLATIFAYHLAYTIE
jgi:hypothetical protein